MLLALVQHPAARRTQQLTISNIVTVASRTVLAGLAQLTCVQLTCVQLMLKMMEASQVSALLLQLLSGSSIPELLCRCTFARREVALSMAQALQSRSHCAFASCTWMR